jgi:hypothetical protein
MNKKQKQSISNDEANAAIQEQEDNLIKKSEALMNKQKQFKKMDGASA